MFFLDLAAATAPVGGLAGAVLECMVDGKAELTAFVFVRPDPHDVLVPPG